MSKRDKIKLIAEAYEGNKASAKPGLVRGTAVVRDKDGNVKGEFTFEGPATPEQIAELTGGEKTDGSHTDDSST